MPEGLLLVVWSSIGLWVVGWVGLWVQSFYFSMGLVGLGQSFGLKKLDPWTTLDHYGDRTAVGLEHGPPIPKRQLGVSGVL